jgi:hypothetical protein
MPDLREVFQMSTQKVRPDQGFIDRQEFRQRRRTRNRRIGAFVLVAAMIVVGAVAIATNTGRGAGDESVPATDGPTSPPPVVVTHYLVNVETGERMPVPTAMAGARGPAVSPDGTMVAFNTCCDGTDNVYLADLDGGGPRKITEQLNGYAPTWTPDGGSLVYQGRDAQTFRVGQLYRYDVVTGVETAITDLETIRSKWWIVRPDVSPDGGTVLFHLPRGRTDPAWDLWTVPIGGGTPTLLRRDAGWGAYGPDGSVVFLDHPRGLAAESLWIVDADGGNARQLVDGRELGWPQVSPNGERVAYQSGDTIEVVEVATGNVATFGVGIEPGWVDDDTLIVG